MTVTKINHYIILLLWAKQIQRYNVNCNNLLNFIILPVEKQERKKYTMPKQFNMLRYVS
jgi:hypothetical protein